MGVADKTGSIEVGKDANIVISEGDILDMKTSIVTDAFIQGRKIDLTDKHKLLNEKYNQKYNIKKPFWKIMDISKRLYPGLGKLWADLKNCEQS